MNTTRTKAIIWGLFLLLISVCLILWKLQFLHLPFGIMNVSVWGVLLGIVFLILFVHSIVHLWYTGILFSLAFLAIVFAKPLHIEALVPGTVLLAALLGSIALHLLFPARPKTHLSHPHGRRVPDANGEYRDAYTQESGREESGYVFHSLKMGAATKYIRMQDFQGADLSVDMGDLKVYFDGTLIPSGIAKINANVNLGNMVLFLPENWRVESHMKAFIGNANSELNGRNGTAEGPILQIEGDVRLGNFEVKRL